MERKERDEYSQLLLFDSDDKVCAVSVKMMKTSDSSEPPRKKARICLSKDQTTGNTNDKMKRLQDICTESQLARKSSGCLQLVIDEKGELYTKLGRPPKVEPSQDPMLSLCEVMSNFKLYGQQAMATPREIYPRRHSGLLATPTARKLMVTDPMEFSEHFIPRTRRPFTRSTVADMGLSDTPGPALRKNAHLHALGIILLELYLNRSIKEDVDAQSGSEYRGIALDLLEEHSDDMNMTAECLRAVQFCLSPHPNPYSGSFSFKDKGFREIFYSEVISMLEDNLMSRFEVNASIWEDEED
ncbi:hypothetical protein PV04_09151 [Phialophora macrospora]|uniref:DUF7580 domain-containing protein n=1 Tax=Phialophora macrospora TaxID=1851006 RepID=A0A0D2F854_9EURO|nr:hypothetical protein PV04_09151 [Phialophora macrospora]